MKRRWPASVEEFDRLEAAARAKYQPLVSRLQPWEIIALHKALGETLDALREEARAEAIRHGDRPPGTRIGA